MNAIFKRTSVRDYSDKPVKKKVIRKLLKAAMAAPSAGNQQPWEFIVVDDATLLQKLTCYSPYSKPVGKSAVSIVLLMRASGLRFAAIAQQDMAACAENILLEAVELGLGGVWQCAFPEPDRMSYIADLFELPQDVVPFAVISLGYPKKGKQRKQQDRYDKKRVNWNAYRPRQTKGGAQPQLEEIVAATAAATRPEAAAETVNTGDAAPAPAEAEKPALSGWRSASNAAF